MTRAVTTLALLCACAGPSLAHAQIVRNASAPTQAAYTVMAATDFESGTIAPFINPYAGVLPGAIDVVPDPTKSGHGKVLRIHYWNEPGKGWYDNNDAIGLDPSKASYHLGLGAEVLFTGDFYLEKSASNSDINAHGLRKLNYWCSSGAGHMCYVLATQPSPGFGDQQLMSSISVTGPSNTPCDCPYYGDATVSTNAWHSLSIRIRFNTSLMSKDGILEVRLDGKTVTSRTDVQWVDPRWTNAFDISDWRIGEQLNSTAKVDEYRYWDNIRFLVKR